MGQVVAEARTAGGGTIVVQGASKVFGLGRTVVQALESIDLSIEGGEFVSVVGPSGCGKTTLMLMVAGLVPVSGGSILVDNVEVRRPLTDIGIVFQDALLLDFRTALGNVALQMQVRGSGRAQAKAQARVVLEQMGLGGAVNRYPHELSGGMRQRVSLGRAFIHNPSILLMDEPFASLDAITRTQMHHDLEQLWITNRKTVLFITHNVEEAVRLSDRIVVMSPSPGRVVEQLVVDSARPRPVAIEERPELSAVAQEIYRCFSELGVLRT
jgi:NitT/TauT family transport system ATP-binding protein